MCLFINWYINWLLIDIILEKLNPLKDFGILGSKYTNQDYFLKDQEKYTLFYFDGAATESYLY